MDSPVEEREFEPLVPLAAGLAATHAGQGLDRGSGFSRDLGNLRVFGLDIGLGEQVYFNVDEFRSRYFTVRRARPVLVEGIEKNELPRRGERWNVWTWSILRMLCRRHRLTVGGEAKRHQSLQIAVPQCIAQGQKRCAQRKR
jgi:hypothetical protein